MRRYPCLTAKAWHEPAAFPLAVALESNATAISAEIGALDAANFHAESERIARTGESQMATF
jgi:hypothetical protein